MDRLTRLKNVHLFASLADEDLERVAALAATSSYRRGSVLCQQDELADKLFVIESGEAVRRQTDLRGIERPVAYLREGDSVGEDALLLGDAFGSCVQATSDVEALTIHKQDLDGLLKSHPQIEKHLNVPRLVRERLEAPAFAWQDEDEPTLLLRRRHWFAFVRTLPAPLIMTAVLSAVAFALRRVGLLASIPLSLLFVGALPSATALWLLLDWRNDYYLVTTRRVLHEEKVYLFYQTWDEVPLSKIQSINITRGFMGSMLGFGTMHIQTASSRGTMALNYLPDPEGMQEVIFKRVGQLRWVSQQEQRETIREELLSQTAGTDAAVLVSHKPAPKAPPEKASGLITRLLPRRPLFGMRYRYADQVVWRRHWVFFLKRVRLVLPFTLLFTAAIVSLSLRGELGKYSLSLLLGALVVWILGISRLWWHLEDWRNDVYIVTDHLVIDIEKRPLFFAEERKQASLDVIQNVSSKKRGFLTTLFDYGDVLIEIAGASGTFTFEGVPRPAAVQREVFRRVEAYNESQRRRESLRRKAELSTWFEVYREMNEEGKT